MASSGSSSLVEVGGQCPPEGQGESVSIAGGEYFSGFEAQKCGDGEWREGFRQGPRRRGQTELWDLPVPRLGPAAPLRSKETVQLLHGQLFFWSIVT